MLAESDSDHESDSEEDFFLRPVTVEKKVQSTVAITTTTDDLFLAIDGRRHSFTPSALDLIARQVLSLVGPLIANRIQSRLSPMLLLGNFTGALQKPTGSDALNRRRSLLKSSESSGSSTPRHRTSDGEQPATGTLLPHRLRSESPSSGSVSSGKADTSNWDSAVS